MRGKPYIKAADIYSFGIIIWEVITRLKPFAKYNKYDFPSAVKSGVRDIIPDDCPKKLKILIKVLGMLLLILLYYSLLDSILGHNLLV